MLIRTILTIAVLGSFVFGAAAQAGTFHMDDPFASATAFTAPGDVAGMTRSVTGRR